MGNLFRNETARKSFLKFILYSGTLSNETSILWHTCFGVNISSTVDTFSANFCPIINSNNVVDKLHISEIFQIEDVKSCTTKSGAIPIEAHDA